MCHVDEFFVNWLILVAIVRSLYTQYRIQETYFALIYLFSIFSTCIWILDGKPFYRSPELCPFYRVSYYRNILDMTNIRPHFHGPRKVLSGRFYFIFLHSVIFIDWMYCDRRGPENRGCLSVCLCVCVWRAVWRNYWADFNLTYTNWSPKGLVVRVCDLAHLHNWWRHGSHFVCGHGSTVTVRVLIRFSWNS